MHATIAGIEYYLPPGTLSNSDLAAQYPEWSIEKIESKTGIACRHIAGENECSSDLAVEAAKRLFESGVCEAKDIDFLLLCTQSPDYFLPTTACIVQERLDLPVSAGAFDFNLGCSGYIYGLGTAKGLIETGQAKRVLLITAETYSKFIHPADKSVRTLFGDAAAATLVTGREGGPFLGPFVYGTDGRGAKNLIVPYGGIRQARSQASAVAEVDASGNKRAPENLYMNGPEIFTFTLESVPACVTQLVEKSGVGLDNIDLFVFHQANQYMLEHLRKKLKIGPERFYVHMKDCGNTVSSTIPIALAHALKDGALRRGQTAMLVGFGVGYSWGATLWRA